MNNPPKWTRLIARFTNPRGLNNPQKLKQAIQGKVVLITGASFDIGEQTAKHLAQHGAIVLLVARSHDKLQQVLQEIIQKGGVAYAYISPPWLWSSQVTSVLLPTPIRKYMEWVFRLTKDSQASIDSANHQQRHKQSH
jgi:NADPH:quinone reductase-like Zn-dependent oxidoreductase